MAQVPGRCGDSPEKVLINYNRHFLQVIPDLEDGEFELPDELQTLAGFKKLWFERPKTYRGVPMGSTQLFPRPSVPSHGGNRAVEPQYWGMIVEQLLQFVQACKVTEEWHELQQSTEFGKEVGHVNGYQVCDTYVKPWTQGTGCSVSLLMNADLRKADVMISHGKLMRKIK